MRNFRKNMIVFMAMFVLMGLNINAKEKTDFIETKVEEVTLFEREGKEINSTYATPSLTGCTLGVSIRSDGLGISYTTSATMNASEIGIKNFVLYEKALIGWKQIPISNYCSYGTDFYTGSVVYTAAVPGKRYKASCTHYAKINGVEYTLNNETSEITYN